jgi:hypothetical protein
MSKDKSQYHKYLLSPEWQRKRLECFAIYGRCCHLCQSTKEVHVHHRTYKNLMNENVEKELIPLCKKHHKSLHKFCDDQGQTIWNGTIKFFKYYKRGGKPVSRKVRLRRKKKKLTKKNNRKVRHKKPKIKVTNEQALKEFQDTLRLIKAEKHLSPEEKHQRMKDRIAKKVRQRHLKTLN